MDWRVFSVLCFQILFCSGESSFLDVAELSTFQYSIDISDQPVLLDESKEKDGILLSSRHGQRYQCQFESLSQLSQKVKEEEENASKTSVAELLEPMEGMPCLSLTTGWWTYEFCYKKQIKQYHVSAEHKVAGEILQLGSFSEEFDWTANQKKKTPEAAHRYHSQQYVNGSICDLTGTMRSAEVRFRCKEDSVDSLDGVEEPSTCRYLVHVSTQRLCRHPSLRPVPDRMSLPITCSPVLTDSELEDYREAQKRRRMRMMTEEEEEEENGKREGRQTSTGEDSSDFDMTDLEKSADVDMGTNGFGFIEIGNTKIKFYVLNYDGILEEVKKEMKAESGTADAESSTTTTSSPPVEESSSTTKTETSSSPSEKESDEASASDSGKPKSGEQQDDNSDKDVASSSNEDDDDDDSTDTKELMEIYKRLLSNKKLKSFVNKKINTQGTQQQQQNEAEESEESSSEKIVEDSRDPVEGMEKSDNNEKKGPEGGGGGSEEEVSDGKEIKEEGGRQKVSDEDTKDLEKQTEKGEEENKENKKDGVEEMDEGGGALESAKTSSPDNADDKSEVHAIGELFKKGAPITSEHKSIHHMIMAIIKQSDRSTKEASRHQAIERNYEFNWKQQQQQQRPITDKKTTKTTTVTEQELDTTDGGGDGDVEENNKVKDEL